METTGSGLIARTAAEANGNVRHWLTVAQQAQVAGHTEQALALLREAATRFPEDAGVLHDLARLAEARRDWTAAERHWRAFVDMAPHVWWAPVQLASALREQGQVRAAEQILAGAMERFPEEPWVFVEHARQATRAADWAEAASRWEFVTQRFPDQPEGLIGQAQTRQAMGQTEEARTLLLLAVERHPTASAPLHDLARLAETDRDWTAAAHWWRRWTEAEPDYWWGYTGLAQAVYRQGRPAEAETILAARIAVSGHEPEIAIEHARLAEMQADWKEAFRRFNVCREKFPDNTTATIGAASALAHDGRMREADTMLTEVIERFPSQVAFQIAWARLPIAAGSRGDRNWLVRSRFLHAGLPGDLMVCRNYIDALQSNHVYPELETLLRSVIQQFPSEEGLQHVLATTLARQEKWQAAFDVFAEAAARHPPTAALLTDYARALTAAKRWDAAKSIINDASRLFPADISFRTALLDILIAQGDLEEAAAEWRDLDARSAATERMRQELFERRNRLLGLGIDPAENRPAAQAGVTVPDIVSRFESLGGHGLGCEFGLFQRHFGKEPIGLLRWADMQPDRLVDALESEFEGVGSAEQTVLKTPPQGNHLEYMAEDRRFGMGMHTFVRVDQVPVDQMTMQICRRLTFLRNKLLSDLRQAEKVFVYKNAHRNLTDPEIEQLHRAIRHYGNTTLFCVRRADEARPFPTVEAPMPGLLIGYIDGFSHDPSGNHRSLPVASWSQLVLAAYRLAL